MQIIKKKEISDKHKQVVDAYFANGLDRKLAYETQYKVPSDPYQSSRNCHIMMQRPEVKEYFNECQKEYSLIAGISKEDLIYTLMNDLKNHEELDYLMSKRKLSEDEYMRFNRFKAIYSQAGKIALINTIAKIIGAFEPEKVQVEQVSYNVGFGTS